MPNSGDQIGPYQVTAVLGFTGLGGVYNAWHTTTQRQVALAVLRPEFAADVEARRQFFAEVGELAKVHHENLVEVLDIVDEAPHHWFAIELLRGVPLAEFLRRAGRLPLAVALHIAWQLCQGLRAAHGLGLVHRALRMDSVFVVEQGGAADVVKILGFMSCSPVGIEAAWPAMAPEQWRDEFVDHRADFYSLGALLYELTTGRRPIQGQTRDELRANHERASVVPPSTFAMTMPPALDALIVQCLAKDPEDRPYMVQEIEAALRDVAGEVPPYQQRPASGDAVGVAIPDVLGWNVVAVTARAPTWTTTWTTTSPPVPPHGSVGDAPDPGEPEALDNADVADLEEAEPLATPWPSPFPPPAPAPASFGPTPLTLGRTLPAAPSTPSMAASADGLANLAAAAAPTTPAPPATAGASLFGDMDAFVPDDLLKDIAAAVDDDHEAPGAPPPRASVLDMFADAVPLLPLSSLAPSTSPALSPSPATFTLVEQAPPAPSPPAAPIVAAAAPAIDEAVLGVQPALQPALRPAMGPRSGVITAVPGAVMAAARETAPLLVGDTASAAPVPPPATAPPPMASSPSWAPTFDPGPSFGAPLVETAPPSRSKLPLIAAAAAAVVAMVVGGIVVMGGTDEPATVAVADPVPAPAPTPSPTPAPTHGEVVPAMVGAGAAAAETPDAGSIDRSADAGVVAATPEPPPPVAVTTGDGFTFPDEPGNAAPPPAPAATKPAATKRAATKPAASKPPATKPVKPAPKPASQRPTVDSKDTLKGGGLVNPFKRK